MAILNGIDSGNLDRTTSPRDNFYRFANGTWLDKNPIPDEYSRWGSFEELNETSNAHLRVILDECRDAVQSGTASTPNMHTKCLGILYGTGLDEKAADKNGFAPISDILAAIEDVQTPTDVVLLKARMSVELGVGGGLFAFYSMPDATNSSWEVACLSQAGALGIGDRDFYVLPDKQDIREKYVAHVKRMLELCGCECTSTDADDLLALETSLAERMLTRTERRDPQRVYNKFDNVSDLAERTETKGRIPWKEVFEMYGLTDDFGVIIVDNPAYLTYLAGRLEHVPIRIWKLYLRYRTLLSMSSYLGTEAEQERFEFHGRAMTGQKEMKPRWKRVLNGAVGALLEDSLGMEYTKRHFTEAAKTMVLDMIDELIEVLGDNLRGAEWMEEVTKQKALLKLSKFKAKVGYPDKWDEFGIEELSQALSLEKSYAENVRLCNVRAFKQMMQRINKPVDTTRWEMPCYMVNAYFHPLLNEICFPAAILQPPFLFHPTEESPHGDPAVNFSAIGAVICHEITHGYDDQGRQFDDKGELVDWWTSKDADEYKARAEKMVQLCNGFEVHGKNLNGKMCLGENIADFGGVRIAFEGLRRFQEKHGKLPVMDGFTAEQRFFIGWATIWRNVITKENALKRVIMDVHAPGEFRANIVQILDEFHKAFDVKEGDPMWAPMDLRCDIW